MLCSKILSHVVRGIVKQLPEEPYVRILTHIFDSPKDTMDCFKQVALASVSPT